MLAFDMSTVFPKVLPISPNRKRMHGRSPISVPVRQLVAVAFKLVRSHVMAERISLGSKMNCATSAISQMKAKSAAKEHVQPIGKRDRSVNVQRHAETTELKRELSLAKKYWKMGQLLNRRLRC